MREEERLMDIKAIQVEADEVIGRLIEEAEAELALARETAIGGRRTVTVEQTGGVQRALGALEALRKALHRVQTTFRIVPR